MKRKINLVWVLTAVILLLAAGLVGVLIFLYNQPPQVRGIPPMIEVPVNEPDSAQWGLNFPNQYTSFLMTKDNKTRTEFGGSEPFSKLDEDPRLVRLFAGNPFSKGYDEERGHMNALDDVRNTPRISDKSPGSCYSCKTANNPKLWAEMGMAAYDAMKFSELGKSIDQPIGCANCHEANSMRLIVTNPALEEALAKQGKDWRTFTRQQMRTVVCANCHVEYYFAGEGKYLTFPWANGTSIESIEQYYDEIQFSDFTHADSGAAMLKAQHPEYEMYTNNSTHFNAGVSCADCHMPYTRDGAVKFSSHNVHSPLINPEKTCATCHSDMKYVVERVKIIQETVHQTMIASEDALVAAIDAIQAAAADPGVDPQKLEEARKLHRSAQLRWDFVAAENSMGFHNPDEALRILASATDLARQAQLKAVEAQK